MEKIKFNNSCKSTHFTDYIELLQSDYDLLRQKHFSNHCLKALSSTYPSSNLFLTHSATGALEMIADLIEIKSGDEIILPSFTFVATANAFVSRGATPVFVDIDPITLIINLESIKAAVTPNTKAVVLVHYFGHSTNSVAIKTFCKENNIFFIEDAAMAYGCFEDEQPLGTLGDFAVVSFDVTKHVSAIQGGMLLVNNKHFKKRASYLYHNGTNRDDFEEGNVLYYEWVDIGSKYQMNELNAAFLWGQIQNEQSNFAHRKQVSKYYFDAFTPIENTGKLKLMNEQFIANNIHGFYIILNSEKEREELRNYLSTHHVEALFHYIPLHLSKMAQSLSQIQLLPATEAIASRLLRLPFHNLITEKEVLQIKGLIEQFFNG